LRVAPDLAGVETDGVDDLPHSPRGVRLNVREG
jgi:hypothetical protein